MDSLVNAHRHLVEGWMLVLFFNLLIPYLLRGNLPKRVLYTRIGYFGFWGAWSMVLFSGLIVFVFMKMPMSASVIAMLAASLVLPIMDGYRAIRLKRLWIAGEDGILFSMKIVAAEIVLLTAVTLYASMK